MYLNYWCVAGSLVDFDDNVEDNSGASVQQNVQFRMCAQRRLRLACAYSSVGALWVQVATGLMFLKADN